MADPFFVEEKPKKSSPLGAALAALRGYADMGLAGWQDEVQGLIQAALPVPGETGTFSERRKRETEAARQDIANLKTEHPDAFMGGQATGLGASLLLPAARAASAAKTVGLTQALARAALPATVTAGELGALSAAGHSEAPTAEGVLDDAGTGAAWSAPFGLVAGVGGEALSRTAAARRAAALAKAESNVDKPIRSAKSAYGGEVQAGSRTGENLTRLNRRPDLSPEEAAKLAELERKVGDNTIEGVGERLSGIDAAKAEYEALKAGREAAIAAELSPGKAAEALGERAKRYVIPMAVGAGLGLLAPGDKRSNMALGAVGGLAMRPTLRAFGRLAWTNPATVTNYTAPALEGAGTLLTKSIPGAAQVAAGLVERPKPEKDPFFVDDPFFLKETPSAP
jgi:hypothetical protein